MNKLGLIRIGAGLMTGYLSRSSGSICESPENPFDAKKAKVYDVAVIGAGRVWSLLFYVLFSSPLLSLCTFSSVTVTPLIFGRVVSGRPRCGWSCRGPGVRGGARCLGGGDREGGLRGSGVG